MKMDSKFNSLVVLLYACSALALTGCQQAREQNRHEVVAPSIKTVKVTTQVLNRTLAVPGEILPYQDVPLYPKVTGFIQWIGVDRGSIVKKGQLLVKLVAPELSAQHSEAQQRELQSRAMWAESNRRLEQTKAEMLEAKAKFEMDQLTYKRMKEASQTPGVIAENDLDILRQTVVADEQRVASKQALIKSVGEQINAQAESVKKAHAAVEDIEDLQAYLNITAPYDGVITERNMHEGSLAYPPSGTHGYPPMLRIKENSLLRIIVPVPEVAVGDVQEGQPIDFYLSAYPSQKFTGKVARIAHSLEPKTRTMPVELNYWNPGWKVSPGMFAEVVWPMKRTYPTHFVPDTAIVTSLKWPFVIKVVNGVAHRVNVVRGQTMEGLVEVFGELSPNDQVVLHGSDDIQDGTHIAAADSGT